MSTTNTTRRNGTGESQSKFIESVLLIASLFRAYPLRSAAGIALLIAANLAESVGIVTLLPLLASFSGEQVAGTQPIIDTTNSVLAVFGITPSLLSYLAIIVIGMVSKGLLQFAAAMVTGYTGTTLMTDLRIRLIRSLMRARWSYFVQQPVGLLSNMLGHEARVAAGTYVGSTRLVTEAIQVAIYAALAAFTSWQMAVGGFVFGLVLLLIMRRLIAMTQQASEAHVTGLRALVAHLADGLNSMKPIKSMALETRVAPMLESRSRNVEHAQRREVLSIALFQSLNEPLLAVFLGAGIYLVLKVLALPFTEVLFMAILFQRMATRIGSLQGAYQGLTGSRVTYRALTETTAETEAASERLGGSAQPGRFDTLSLDHVDFAHDDTPVLHDVSIQIPANRITAIVGPSGAGKTTIVDLIIGLNVPDRGAVLLDDTSLAEVDIAWWRSQIGYVPQETVLFNDSILRNVTLGDETLTPADAHSAIAAAGLSEFLDNLPDGLETNVGERGNRVSGGQRQRLAIARALVRKPALLIFDEATTALDPETEKGILETLRTLSGRLTIVAISHQPALLDAADLVYRIVDGRIISSATNSRPEIQASN